MNFLFIDPTTGQVMAKQSTPNIPTPTAWETNRGFLRIEVEKDSDFSGITRDFQITHDGKKMTSAVASINPIQPTPNPRHMRIAELREKVRNDTDNPAEFRELYKLENNLL